MNALSLLGVTGCVGLPDDARQPELVSLTVVNQAADPVTVDVQLVRNDDVVLWRLLDLAGSGAADDERAGTFPPPEFPAETGRWELLVRIPATGEQATLPMNADTYAGSCLRVTVDVQSAEHLSLQAGQKSDACLDD